MGKMKISDGVAIIGMACKFPGADNIKAFWENLRNGEESISFFSEKELLNGGIPLNDVKSREYVKAKGYIKDCDYFDADFFGYPPRDAVRMDPQIRLLHECSYQALESAAYDPGNTSDKIGAFFGANENQEWLRLISQQMTNDPSDQYDNFILNFREYTATRVAHNLNLTGPSFTVLTACSTSLVAVHLACQSLESGECDMALAGGVSLSFPMKAGYHYREGLMVSEDGHCRTFDQNASGTVFGDGIGVVLLKPLPKAIRDNDHIHAVIKGSAINNDGSEKKGYTAPSQKGQEAVIRSALKNAGIDPRSVGYIEAHGTATRVGDPIETMALKNSYGPTKSGFRKIGSVKTNIGHVNVASGAASLIKVALAVANGEIPPHLNFNKLNPEIEGDDTYFSINTELSTFPRNDEPRRAGVSAFGFGGTNAHMIVEEPPKRRTIRTATRRRLVPISARSLEALQKREDDLIDYLDKNTFNVKDVAFSLSEGRKHFKYRNLVISEDLEELIGALKESKKTTPSVASKKKMVFLFPGQGSQYVNMAKGLFENEPVFRETLMTCDRILRPLLQVSLIELIYPINAAPETAQKKLMKTQFAQPAIFSISYSIAKLLESLGIKPDIMVGHSVGEYTAACLSGVFTLKDALHLVAKRGKLIQNLPTGEMMVVTLDQNELDQYLSSEVSLAAVNAPGLSVLSGTAQAISTVKERLSEAGATTQALHTSHPFHSHKMEPILSDFEAIFENEIKPRQGKITMISTVTGKETKNGDLSTADYWKKNIRQTVQFSSAIQKLLTDDYIMLEVGPGTTLGALVKMNQNGHPLPNTLSTVPNPLDQHDDHLYFLKTLGNLWKSGMEISWKKLFHGEKPGRIPLPTYPFERQKFSPVQGRMQESGQPSAREHLIKNPDLKEWFYVPTWKRTLASGADLNFKKKYNWLIFSDDSALSNTLMKYLDNAGQRYVTLRAGKKFEQLNQHEFTLNPTSLDDYERFFTSIEKHKLLPDRIIHLWSYQKKRKAKKHQYPQFFSLLFLAQVIGKHNYTRELNLAVITREAQQIIGTEDLNTSAAEVFGPLKVIPQEFPSIQSVNIDFERDQLKTEDQCEHIFRELQGAMDEITVGYRNQWRWVQRFEKCPVEKTSKENKIRKDGVFLITGGLGGLGLVMADLLTKHAQAGIILTTRSEFPSENDWDTWLRTKPKDNKISAKIRRLQKLVKKGARIKIVQADVSDFKEMKSKITLAEKELGMINGVIHAAGLPGEGIIQLKELDVIEKVMKPKLEGTENLLDIFKEHELDFMMLCSSIASILGGVGLVDYCSANGYLDSVAMARKLKGNGSIISVNWDMWGETGMGLKTYVPTELKEWFDNELKNGITSREGQEVFRRIINWNGSPNVIISTRDLQTRINLWIKREFFKEQESSKNEEKEKPKFSRPNLSIEYVAPNSKTEQKVAKHWGDLFGIEKIGRYDNFFEIGGHSLLATILVNKLRKEFGKNLSIRDVMDHPTVNEIATVIDNK
ncbi:beta-ketoacyl synthase N-terminal-like domain-containing protein [Fulvivirgaceae bacterium BMA10]|uniref:Beta-ketoacyl synthase N-terminal-like domain-containing protein n=1 Tax=Splendidivirga corallicola TaxID=3051826 RepID=A0ABT8KNR7_9BACT|nr:beta-ketoacyl synthase N-terminal-like domain-containing protein [Fulvivirgaceae bacterium BMA10]